MKFNVSIVISTYNNACLIKQCVKLIRRFDYSEYLDFMEIVIVDDGSEDNTPSIVSSLGELVSQFIRHPVNKGHASAINSGWKSAKGDYIITLHDDVMICDGGWMLPLLYPVYSGKSISGACLVRDNGWNNIDGRQIHYLEGWCICMHRSCLNDIGYIDEMFNPAYSEDMDYSWRAGELGYQLVEADCPLIHLHNQTMHYALGVKKDEISFQNHDKFREKIKKRHSLVKYKILCIRYSCRGDILATTHAVRLLKQKYKAAEITYACMDAFRGLLERNPYIDRIISRIDGEDYDFKFEFEHEGHPSYGNGRKSMAEVYCEIADVSSDNMEYNIYPSIEDYHAVSFIEPGTISIVANAGWRNKMWPYEKWSELSRMLIKDGYNILQLGGPGQPYIRGAYYMADSTPLRDCAALSKCILHIGVDTFALHASIAMKTRRCILFGPTSPHNNTGSMPIYIGDDGIAIEGHGNDINNIKVLDVYDKVKEIMI